MAVPLQSPLAVRKVEVVDYDDSWPQAFALLRERVWPPLRGLAVSIEHVGSTSVPGLAAKPIIDLDIVIPSAQQLPRAIGRLASLGYSHQGDFGVEGREAFSATVNVPPHHLYVCLEGCLALRNHLTVRDYLRAHPSDAAAYSALKNRLAAEHPYDRDAYNEGKTDFVLSILARCGFAMESLESIWKVNQKPGPG